MGWSAVALSCWGDLGDVLQKMFDVRVLFWAIWHFSALYFNKYNYMMMLCAFVHRTVPSKQKKAILYANNNNNNNNENITISFLNN